MRRQICSGLVWLVILGVGYFSSTAALPPPDPLETANHPAPPRAPGALILPYYLGENVRVVQVVKREQMSPLTQPAAPGEDFAARH